MSPWFPTIHNLWIGLCERAYRDEFDYVVAVGDEPVPTDDGLRVRQFPVPQSPDEANVLIDCAVAAIEARWLAGKTVLVQSVDVSWAEVIAGAVLIHLGATLDEAILSLRETRPEALSDPQLLNTLWTWRDAHA